MSEWVKLKANDGHVLSAYVARPQSEPVGALVLIQEIFGVNGHIRRVADGYAGTKSRGHHGGDSPDSAQRREL